MESKLLPKMQWLQALAMRSSQLPSKAVEVGCWLADYADEHGRAWPARSTLAKLLGCCDRTIGNALAGLRDDGWITPLVQRVGPGKRQQWAINWHHRQEFSCEGLNEDTRRRVAKLMGEQRKETARSQAETGYDRGNEAAVIADRNLHTIPPSYPTQKSYPPSLPVNSALQRDASARLYRAMRVRNGLIDQLLNDQNSAAIEAEAIDIERRQPGNGIAVVIERLNWSPQKGGLVNHRDESK